MAMTDWDKEPEEKVRRKYYELLAKEELKRMRQALKESKE